MSAIALILNFSQAAVNFSYQEIYMGVVIVFEELQARQIAYFHYFNTLNELEEQISSTIAAVF